MTDHIAEDLKRLEERLGFSFQTKELLLQALTHRSYLNENRNHPVSHNERLEYLGDAVLELVITEELYNKYPNKPEGELTSIRAAVVNTGSISRAADEIGLGDFLLLSKGEAKDLGRARGYILANTFESVVGALYLDQGYDAAKKFIDQMLFDKIKEVVATSGWYDSKSLFQEKSQEHIGITPTYKTTDENGPDHAKRFTVGVYLGKELVVTGEGYSKQEAEQEAAARALALKGWK